MLILLDTGPTQAAIAPSELGDGVQVAQLLTPLTNYAYRGGRFAIDNGAFSSFDAPAFLRLLDRMRPHAGDCMFVSCPDVVGSARRTLEVFDRWHHKLHGFPVALVCQDGQEDLEIPWDLIAAVFIGGSTEWKLSRHVEAIIAAAKTLDKWVHVGRVNTPERFAKFASLGVNSIDGSGIAQYSHMRHAIRREVEEPKLFEATHGNL